MTKQNRSNTVGDRIAKARGDETFKQRLLKDATAVFKELGVPAPQGMQINVSRNTEELFHLAIPPQSEPKSMSDNELASAVDIGEKSVEKIAARGVGDAILYDVLQRSAASCRVGLLTSRHGDA